MLGWSINLFRVFGIRLAVHFSFLLLLAYAAWEGVRENSGSPWLGAAANAGVILALFTCIVLHELGHSLTARRFGIKVRRILLLPIGGMAEFDSIPRQPRQELLITVAGPAVNFVIVLALLCVLPSPWHWNLDTVEFNLRSLGELLLFINLVMGCFNLIPVFPMDGGRILRALLATRWPYLQATYWAATIGKVLAVVGAIVMAFYLHNVIGALLFAFIFVAGDLEYRAIKRQEEEQARWDLMIRQLYRPVNTDDSNAAIDVLHGPN